MMRIYGCDFSGAKDAAGKICICKAEWDGTTLRLKSLYSLEERLDLVYLIRTSPGLWGVDMPFSVPHPLVERFGGWHSFVRLANQLGRERFKELFPARHSRKQDRELFRETDLIVGAKSPISATPLDMRGMLYGSMKVLDLLLHDDRVRVYPFMKAPDGEKANLFEVYPRTLLQRLQLSGQETLTEMLQAMQSVIRLDYVDLFADVHASERYTEHLRDAVCACLVMAIAAISCGLDRDWQRKPPFATETEWSMRKTEGIITRI